VACGSVWPPLPRLHPPTLSCKKNVFFQIKTQRHACRSIRGGSGSVPLVSYAPLVRLVGALRKAQMGPQRGPPFAHVWSGGCSIRPLSPLRALTSLDVCVDLMGAYRCTSHTHMCVCLCICINIYRHPFEITLMNPKRGERECEKGTLPCGVEVNCVSTHMSVAVWCRGELCKYTHECCHVVSR